MPRERGFTLLEILVAFTIAAFAFVVLFRAAGGGLSAVKVAGRYEEAVSRAQSHMAAIGRDVTLSPGELQGDDGSGYHWRIAVDSVAVTKPPSSDDADDGPQLAPPFPVSLYKILVEVSWTEDGRTRSVQLRTERLGQAEHVDDG